jgi:hypothetical protein
MATSAFLGRRTDYAQGEPLASTEYNALVADVEQLYAGISAYAHPDTASPDLTDAEDEPKVIVVTGTLTANRNLVLRTVSGAYWWVHNSTTGGFSITAKTSGGTGIAIPASQVAFVRCDVTNIVNALPGLVIGTPAANADTSGATLGQLETEVNQLKALLRTLGFMAP